MEQGQIVLGLLAPADQQTPKPVQPTTRAFYHPTARLDPHFSPRRGGQLPHAPFTAARPDMRRVAPAI